MLRMIYYIRHSDRIEYSDYSNVTDLAEFLDANALLNVLRWYHSATVGDIFRFSEYVLFMVI